MLPPGMKVGSYSFGDVTKRKIAIQLSEISKFIRKIQSKHTESLATEEQNDDAVPKKLSAAV
jgi:hypothetical protein